MFKIPSRSIIALVDKVVSEGVPEDSEKIKQILARRELMAQLDVQILSLHWENICSFKI